MIQNGGTIFIFDIIVRFCCFLNVFSGICRQQTSVKPFSNVLHFRSVHNDGDQQFGERNGRKCVDEC
jgi:hypothetical protein